MGGMEDVVKSVSVSQVLIPEVPASLVTSNWYLSLRKELKNSKYDVVYPHVGEGYHQHRVNDFRSTCHPHFVAGLTLG